MEFLELALLFIGEKLPKKEGQVIFNPPGADHHARWMSKAIYCLKMFLFRFQFELTESELNGLRNVCIFIIKHYLENWFRCPIAAEAAYQDFNFLKTIMLDKSINPKLSDLILKKFKNHLWYLAEESMGLAFFDSSIPIEIKQEMVDRLRLDGDDDDDDDDDDIVHQNGHKVLASLPEIKKTFLKKKFSDFVTRNTINFFAKFKIPTEFLHEPIDWWESSDSYQKATALISQIKVTNDTAERKVQLMSKFIGILTKNDKELQAMVTVVDEYNKENPTSLKRDSV